MSLIITSNRLTPIVKSQLSLPKLKGVEIYLSMKTLTSVITSVMEKK